MNQSANLEARVRALELEYARLNERPRTVGAALGGAESLFARTAPPKSECPYLNKFVRAASEQRIL